MTPAELQTAAAALVAKHGAECIGRLADFMFQWPVLSKPDAGTASVMISFANQLHREFPDESGEDQWRRMAAIVYEAALLAARAQERERIIKLMEYYETQGFDCVCAPLLADIRNPKEG